MLRMEHYGYGLFKWGCWGKQAEMSISPSGKDEREQDNQPNRRKIVDSMSSNCVLKEELLKSKEENKRLNHVIDEAMGINQCVAMK